ncbi:MAG: hypothetical protein KC547_09985 [Anaerolineae bacterium]|nr:hypothetical protein [Anaerolineae bacterium]
MSGRIGLSGFAILVATGLFPAAAEAADANLCAYLAVGDPYGIISETSFKADGDNFPAYRNVTKAYFKTTNSKYIKTIRFTFEERPRPAKCITSGTGEFVIPFSADHYSVIMDMIDRAANWPNKSVICNYLKGADGWDQQASCQLGDLNYPGDK